MKKILSLLAFALLVSSQLFAASYWVVLKDGTKYEATARPVVANGRATVTLKNGQVIQVAAEAIDAAKSEEVTRLGGASLLGVEQAPVASRAKASSLGSQIKLRQPTQQATTAPTTAQPAVTGPVLGNDVIEKFERAYENVGVFEHKITSTGAHVLRAEVTTDSEDKVFNIISATAYLIVKNAGLNGVTIDEVDLFMKMTNGGTAGRFQLTRGDADALYAAGKTPDRTKLQEYFVTKVLF
jgi:hypothetical protein